MPLDNDYLGNGKSSIPYYFTASKLATATTACGTWSQYATNRCLWRWIFDLRRSMQTFQYHCSRQLHCIA